MRSFRNITLAALVTISAFCAIVYSSCNKEQSKNSCDYLHCQNGGTCDKGICTCPDGYSGLTCQTHTILPTCPLGYSGDFCQTKAFINTWAGNSACSGSGSGPITMSIYQSGSTTNSVVIYISSGSSSSYSMSGILSEDAKTITYTDQIKYTGGSYYDTLNGSMTLTDNTHFTYNYTVRNGTVSSCNGTFEKQ